MRVFLTGGTGFLGSEVARLLRERGDTVRALVRSPERASALSALGCELVQGDLSDEAALVEACRGMTAVVHSVAVHDLGAPRSCAPRWSTPTCAGPSGSSAPP
jgi:dihydroflavonol-4-reductase